VVGDVWDNLHYGADIGVSWDRQWVYEIYGLRTWHPDMRRAVIDFRSWVEAHVTGFRARTMWWVGLHDFTEEREDLFFDPSDIRYRDGSPSPEPASADFLNCGMYFWPAGAPRQHIALAPYVWFDITEFLQQRDVVPDPDNPDTRHSLARYQVGSRLDFSFTNVGLEVDLYLRGAEQMIQSDLKPLDYFQIGMQLAFSLDFPEVSARFAFNAWYRFYRLTDDAAVVLPGGLYLHNDPTDDGATRVLLEVRGRPKPWLEIGLRYEWDEWASSLPDFGYGRHDLALLAAIKF
jgi:hypothetical protein